MQVRYEDGEDTHLVAMEVIARHDEQKKWLVAFFESGNNRLFAGVLNFGGDEWSIRRIKDSVELKPWHG